MKAIDTNVVVRALVQDDAVQTVAALKVISAGAWISMTVLLETRWVLGSPIYRFSRPEIADLLARLFDFTTVAIENEAGARWALDRFVAGADFADMLHIASARDMDAFATFDRAIARQAGPDAPIAIETL